MLADESSRKLKGNQPTLSWRFRLLEAEILLYNSDFRGSNTLLADIPPGDLPYELIAKRAILQGRTWCRLGRPPDSAFDQAAGIIKATDRQLQAELVFARGKCASISSPAQARAYYQQSADLAHGVDNFLEARALLDVGNFLLHEHQYADAIQRFEEVLKLSDAAIVRERALGNLGFGYSQLGEFRRAAQFSAQAVSISADLHSYGNQKKWLIDLGRENFTQMDYSEAENAFRKALSLAQQLQDRGDTATCLHDLAQLALRTGALTKAEDYIGQLEKLQPGGSQLLTLLLDRAELAKTQGQFPTAELYLKQILDSGAADPLLRRQAQSDLAVIYVAQKNFDQAEMMFRAAIATAEATRSKIQNVEYRISFLDYAPFFDEYVRFLVSRNRPLEALEIAELGRSPTLSEALKPERRAPVRGALLKRIQRQLQVERGVILAYWEGLEESYLWAITPKEVRLFHLPAEIEIRKALEAYNREIIDRDETGTLESGEKLYNLLIRPAAPLIPRGANVTVIPQRRLYNLNFETIVVPEPTPHYWIEDVRLRNASFLSALVSRSSEDSLQGSKKLLLMGAPVQADKQFPVLKYAAQEMTKVASHFPAVQETVLASDAATPKAYLDSKPSQYKLVHFVTHGTNSTVVESPLDASIILSPTGGASSSTVDPEGSYHLYGKEIMNTPLRADLVTVSACYGLGREYSGEGLVGLAWAFLHAGAHQVIAALWEVDDASTPQLMDDFYGELTQGKSAAEALRDAKLKMLHSSDFHRHPYYWASLQLYTGF